MDIVADDIIKAADVVNNVAHMVERVSEEVEKDTDKVQQRMAGHKVILVAWTKSNRQSIMLISIFMSARISKLC